MKKPAPHGGHYSYDCDCRAFNDDDDSRSSRCIGYLYFCLYDYDRYGSDEHIYAGHGKTGAPRRKCKCAAGNAPLLLGSIVSPLVGIDETTAVPMGAIMFVTAVIGSLAFLD